MTRMDSALGAIKELITIIMGVAVANIVVSAASLSIAASESVGPTPHQGLGSRAYLVLGLALALMAIRFYHGNLRALDEEWAALEKLSGTPAPSSAGVVELLDFAVVVSQGILFAAFGLLLRQPDLLRGALLVLFVTDLIFAVTGFFATDRIAKHRRYWLTISMLSLFFLCIQYLLELPYAQWIGSVLVLGTIADYVLNWSLYFPSPEPSPSQTAPPAQGNGA